MAVEWRHIGFIACVIILAAVGLWAWTMRESLWNDWLDPCPLVPTHPADPNLARSQMVRYRNFDSAASTPPLKCVWTDLRAFFPMYANIHRGHGIPSQVCTRVYDECRREVLSFVHAPAETHVCIFGKNTTECLNKLAWYFTSSCACAVPDSRDVILVTKMDHHSNLLPWRKGSKTVRYVNVVPDGSLDLRHLEELLSKYSSRVSVVAVCGASNVTGIAPPLRRIAAMAHAHGAYMCVDGAQLVPHLPVHMDRDGIDFLCFSGHKMYAPFGIGVLVGPRAFFHNQRMPCMMGGGEVELVSARHVIWKPSPEKDEEGTPNLAGAVALRSAMRYLTRVGMDTIADRERDMYAYAHRALQTVPGLVLRSPPPGPHPHVGILSFDLPPIHHHLVGAVLSREHGIGTRTGCFCAHLYVQSLLGISDADIERTMSLIQSTGDFRSLRGFVRASIWMQTTRDDIDALVSAVRMIRNGRHGSYRQLMSGEFVPAETSS